MTKLEIKGRFDDLVVGIRGDAEKFGLSAAALADDLRFVAMDYLILEADYAASRTRGEVLNEIAHVAKGDVETISRRSGVLAGEALAAVCGQYPVASIKLNGLDDYRDVFVPGRLDLEVAAFKKMAAVHTRKNAPVLFAAKGVSTGLESARASDPRISKQTLAAFAREAPELFAEAVGHAEALLKQTLQVGDGAAGRNLRVEDNLKAPAKWQLINLVLDLIWPIERGAMHSSLMRHARNIVEQVIFYVEGAFDREGGESRLTRDGLITLGGDEDDSGRVRHYRFDSGWFSSILTYRHQINTLRQAVQFVEQRTLELQAHETMSDYIWKRLERLERVAFYPLLDWRRELERRLREADYRTADETVRRPTGGVFGLPDVPKLKSGLSQAQITIRLIHAWKHYSGKKTPPNKGKSRRDVAKSANK